MIIKRIVVRSFLIILLSIGLMGQAKFAQFMIAGPAARSPLMVVLDFIGSNPYSNDQPFLNAYKSGDWCCEARTRSGPCSDVHSADAIPTDSNDYPTKLSPTGNTSNATRFSVFTASTIKTGTYHVYYDGTPGAGGQLELCGARVSGFTDDGAGTITVTLSNTDASAIYTIYYTTSTGGNLAAPLSNFRMCYAGNVPDTTTACKNGTEYFDPTFMANVTQFAGVRPVGWGQSLNNSTSLMDYPANVISINNLTWAANPQDSIQPWPEVPIEVQSQLCQEGGFTYCLFSMPQQMTSAYITHWATVAHSIITNSNTKVLLEHCDEAWNTGGGFCTSPDAVAAPMTTIFPTCTPGFTCAQAWHVYQTAQLHNIWHSVWGADSSRVIASYGTQIGNFSGADAYLTFPAEAYNASSPTTVTFTGTSPVTVNWTGSNMTAGQAVSFTTTGSLPSGLIPTTQASDGAAVSVSWTNGSANIGWTANGLLLNQPVYFNTIVPSNITPYKVYYVVTTGTNTIQVSATIGGSAIVAASQPGGGAGGQPSTQDYYVTNDGSLGANSFHISDTVAHALAGTGTINVSGSASGTTTGYKLLWPNRLADGNVDAENTAPYFGDQGQLYIKAWSADAAGLTKAFAELTTGGQIPQCTGENTTAGGTTAYTLTSDATWGGGTIPATPANGQMIQFQMNSTIAGNPSTLKVDGGNVYQLQNNITGAALPAGAMTSGNCYIATFTSQTASGAVATPGWRAAGPKGNAPIEPSTGGVIPTVGTYWATDYQLANWFGIKLFAYEGGEALTDFGGGDADIETMYTAMIQDSRILGVYNQYYSLLRSTAPNAAPLTAYVLTRPWIAPGIANYNHWGHIQYPTQTPPLKFNAIANFR